MQANTAPLLSILGASNARFVMPAYQRGYSWDGARRRELFDDVMWAGRNGARHFVGSVLLSPLGGGTVTTVNRLAVVDGQQRLISLTLLLDRLLRRLDADPDAASFLDMTPAGLRRQYVFDPDSRGDLRYRIDPTDRDRATLWHLTGDAPEPADPARNLMEAARDFDGMLSRVDPETVWRGLRGLTAIDAQLDGDDDAQRIFESMNARGADLGAMDLIRNWILMHVPFDDQRAFQRDEWDPVAALLDPDPRGRESFVRHWLTSLDPTARRRGGDVYRMFKELWRDRRWDATEAARSMHAAASDWRAMFLGGETDPRLAAAYRDLDAVGIIQIRPVMLALGRLRAGGRLDADGMIRCCRTLESWLMRRSVLRMNNGAVTTMNDRLLRAFREGGDIPETVAAELLAHGPADRSRCPGDAEFAHALETGHLYGLRNGLARAILIGIENRSHPAETVGGDLTVEHIMPRTLSDAWRAALGPNADGIHDKWGDTLGNLTLTGSNSALSNKPFDVKERLGRIGYRDSPLWLNRTLAGRDSWDAAAIGERGRMLARAALERWPMPSAPTILVERAKGVKRDRTHRPELRFAMLGIRPGSRLDYVGPGGPASVTTCDDGKDVLLDGERMTLSRAAARIARIPYRAQGAHFFAFDGERLDLMRDRLEQGRARDTGADHA